MATLLPFLQDHGGHYFLFGPRGTGKSTWLREAYADARQRSGLRRRLAVESAEEGRGEMHRIIEEKKDALRELCDRFAVRRLEVFGSAVAGPFDAERSDIDFLVELAAGTPAEMADRYFGLREALEALFARPIDLVMIPAIRNPYFLQGIERSRTLLYAA